MRCWRLWRGSPRRSWDRRSTVSFRQDCCFGRACRRTQATCSSMPWCRTRPMARCCASQGARFTPVSPKPLKADSSRLPLASRAAAETKAAATQARSLIEQAEALGEPSEDHPLLLFSVRRRRLIVVLGTRVLPVRVPEGDLKPCGLSASNASGAAPCRSARHTCDAAGRRRPPDPCIRRIQRDRNDSRLREMQRQRDSAKHHAANERCSDDC